MKKEKYTFSARYQDVDFARIIEENSSSDFILVEWSGGMCSEEWEIVLVTTKGFDRLANVGLQDGISQCYLRIDSGGDVQYLLYSGLGSSPASRVSYVKGDFNHLYAKLLERENRRRRVNVTGIV
jgi:hypothetical protein